MIYHLPSLVEKIATNGCVGGGMFWICYIRLIKNFVIFACYLRLFSPIHKIDTYILSGRHNLPTFSSPSNENLFCSTVSTNLHYSLEL